MKAVFLDRDGVINENRLDHVKSWSEFRLLPGAAEAMARLSRTGVKLFVISNQAVVNRGIVSRSVVDGINLRMVRGLEAQGVRIEAVVYCPHMPEEQCECRKPRPGLILNLTQQHALDPKDCVLIGDALTDIDAGQAAGCQTVLVLTGRGRDQLAVATTSGKNGFGVAIDLAAAVDMLLESRGLAAA